MPMDWTRYGGNWRKVSRTIRRIANNCCERCGIENGVPLPSGARGKDGRILKVVLTVAHIGAPRPDGAGWTPGDKHDKHDVRRENLQALCQRCHLTEDIQEHIANRKENRRKKQIEAGQLTLIADCDAVMTLFDEIEPDYSVTNQKLANL